MNREMNTGLLHQAQNAGSTPETMRRLEELFARGCYGDLTAAQHERLDRIDNNNPAIRQAIDHYATNGCQDCGGRLSATDRADFRLSCRPCRKLNEKPLYTKPARPARPQPE